MNISARTAWFRIKKIKSDEWLFFAFIALFFSMPLGTSPPTICAAFAAFFWIISGNVFKMWNTCFKKTWFWPVLFFMILPWVGLLYTQDTAGLGIKFAGKTHYWIYCMAIASISFTVYPAQRLIQAFLAGLALNAIVGILQLAGIFPRMNPISFGLGLGYNTLSAYLIVGMLTASYYFREVRQKRLRMMFGLLTLLFFFHLIILMGRAGYLTFFFLCPIIAYNFLRGTSLYKAALISLLLTGAMLLSPIVRERIQLSINQVKHHLQANPDAAWGKEYSAQQDRFYMWRGALRIFLTNPLIGVGTGGYRTVLKDMGDPEWPGIAHPHNNILDMAVSFGLMGIIVIFWFFWEIFKNSWRERKSPLGFFVLSTVLVMFVGGLVDTYIKDAGTLLLLAVVTGIQNGLRRFQPTAPGLISA